MRPFALTAAAVIALDQVSKYLVVHVLALDERLAIEVLPPVLNFRMAWNTGINFGVLEISRWVLIAVALAIAVWVAVWVWRGPRRLSTQLAAGALVGGALGNVIDRLLYGAVADFLNMSCCGIDNPFAFNLADVAVFAGALGLVVFTGRKNPP